MDPTPVKQHQKLFLTACSARDNSPEAYARELFKPSIDSWNLAVWTENKNFSH